MKILVRLPNWLGDMIMCTAFLEQLKNEYPHAGISVIAKKGLHPLLEFFPSFENQFVFSKEEYPGIKGAYRFGKLVAAQVKPDKVFCLPDSFSSALMCYGTGAAERIGYKKELRSPLLTHAYEKTSGIHRVEQYCGLLAAYLQRDIAIPPIKLLHDEIATNRMVININSEAVSRRLPFDKALSLVSCIRKHTGIEIVLIGGPKEKEFVDRVFKALADKNNIHNVAGQTSLPEMARLIAGTKLMLTTDSGPAHLANALGVHTIVLFGAGNEYNTGPYNKDKRSIIRLGELKCEPCLSNECKLYGVPKCLTLLNDKLILNEVQKHLTTIEI